MADNVSQETASEPAELSFDEAVALLGDDDEKSPESTATAKSEQEATEDETAEAVEDDADQSEEDDASQEDAEQEAKDDVLIKMADGSTVTVSELKAEAVNLKAENARISQDVAIERRELQQMGAKVAETFDNVVTYLASKLPPEPDGQLIWSDPTRHHQMTYLRNAAIEELRSLIQAKQGVEETQGQLGEIELKKLQADETAKLIAAVPSLKDPARMKSATDKSRSYAKSIGFSDAEFDTTHDARIRRMVIDAAYGAIAREAAQKAKVQVKTAVAKSPVAQRSVHPNSLNAIGRANAMRSLKTSGSMKDAMKIDFT